jgi:hypothetical protein
MIRWMRYTTWTSDRMFVSYKQYYLQGDEFLSEYDDADTVTRIFEGNSLAAGGPEHLTVLAGTHTGWIRLTTQHRADEPPLPGEEWETVVEEHFLSVWPAPPEPDTVHRANDTFARTHYDPTRPTGWPVQP